MFIPVVLSGGQEELVSKEELQFLLDVHQVMLFKRSDGWVFVGQDKMRVGSTPYEGKESRTHEDFSTVQDDVFSLDA
jgi:hypothetical protein